MTNVYRLALVVLFSVLMTACSSIPLSTMWKMRNFGEQQFFELNGQDIRVRVRLPVPTKLNLEKTELKASLETEHGTHGGPLQLEQESVRTFTVTEGLIFGKEVAYSEYVLRLNEGALQQFSELQRLAPQHSQARKSSFGVNASFTEFPLSQDSLTLRIDLLLSPTEGYFTLLDDVKVTIKSS